MPVEYYTKFQNDILFVVASGADNGYREMLKYRSAVLKKAKKLQCALICCSEHTLFYDLTFKEMNRLGERLPEFITPNMKIAVVCNLEIYDIIRPFEVSCVKQGVKIKFVTSYQHACEWLLNDMIDIWSF